MKLTYYGHSCFMVEAGGKKLIFDPFIRPNELAKNVDIKGISADYILVSHGHADHIADCLELADQTGATVITSFEVAEWLGKNGLENVHSMNHGGQWKFDFGTVKCTNAVHSSSLPDGSYGGNPMGFIIKAEQDFYYSGDTALTMDMQLIPRWCKPDFIILPIGDNYTMGYEDAIIAAEMIGCQKVIGVHYDTFGYIKINKQQVKSAFSEAGLNLLLPAIGESIEL
jgi:L-ascorbate metabolism protein UlaG (beta-lactamase superfamily)